MELIPAIDIRGGRCVRLLKGDFDRETRYDYDPVELAARYAECGARRLPWRARPVPGVQNTILTTEGLSISCVRPPSARIGKVG